MIKYSFILLIFVFFSCGIKSVNTVNNSNVQDSINGKVDTIRQSDLVEIKLDELKLLRYDVNSEFDTSLITIYNQDKSIYTKISFQNGYIIFDNTSYSFYEKFDELKSILNKNFSPREFHPEYSVLIFNCIGTEGDFYKVKIDSSDNYKLININNQSFKFESIEEHLLNVFIGFDINQNPIRKFPQTNSEIQYSKINIGYIVTKVEGDWIKVKCLKNGCPPCVDEVEGWIKWKNGNDLLVKFYYAC